MIVGIKIMRNYFYWLDVIIAMIMSILERLLLDCFCGKQEEVIDTIVMNDYGFTLDTPREEKVNIGRFGRTNSESCIIIRRKGLLRSKTI